MPTKLEPIVLCIYSEGSCCIFESCPVFKRCFPKAAEEGE